MFVDARRPAHRAREICVDAARELRVEDRETLAEIMAFGIIRHVTSNSSVGRRISALKLSAKPALI